MINVTWPAKVDFSWKEPWATPEGPMIVKNSNWLKSAGLADNHNATDLIF
jgi:hypothetical protein